MTQTVRTIQETLSQGKLCQHLEGKQPNLVTLGAIVDEQNTGEDQAHCLLEHGPAMPFLLCEACRDQLPSYQANQARIKANRQRVVAESLAAEAEVLERFGAGEKLYQCTDCGEIIGEDDTVPVRECPHCEETFSAEDGRNCTQCNRPFSRAVTQHGCRDCLGEDELEEITTIEQITGEAV